MNIKVYTKAFVSGLVEGVIVSSIAVFVVFCGLLAYKFLSGHL